MEYIINDKNLVEDINGIVNDYIGLKKNENGSYTYTKKLKEVYEKTFEILITEHDELNEEDFKVAYDKMEYPLDDEIMQVLNKLIGDSGEIQYSKVKELDKLWLKLIEKSINCLRFFDTREPFMLDGSKKSSAYGIDKLEEYHKRYINFESLLYGSSEYYRDHIFHAIRTWMVGIFCLMKKISDSHFIEKIQIDGVNDETFANSINILEKISIWTLSALCHDLGYPLEKSQQIIDKTKEMMRDFVPNPSIISNFSFSGVQDSINEYIVKFMSTKMKKGVSKENGEQVYNGRIQPKYYLKYTKSLEKNNHGIISSVIIYKMLLYFIESDFNLNDDYEYKQEDARQFYIRREVLRAISSHTCSDIYNIKTTTFSSLLFICDEMQEWGRKSWNDLYTSINPNSIQLTVFSISPTSIHFKEDINMGTISERELVVDDIVRLYERQFDNYQLIFRDGQDSNTRAFDFKKEIFITSSIKVSDSNNIKTNFEILAKGQNRFSIDLKNSQISIENLKKRFCERLSISTLPPVIELKS